MDGDHETSVSVDHRGDARDVLTRPVASPETRLAGEAPRVASDSLRRIELPFEAEAWKDRLTGCDGPRLWDRDLASEQERNTRHRRTATIALVELAGIDVAAERWGRDLAEQLFLRLSRVLASGIRSSDHIARIAPTRFGVLLVETDEILAINFVDRIKAMCASDIDPEVHGFRIAIGWASPTVGGELAAAQELAGERLDDDLHRRA